MTFPAARVVPKPCSNICGQDMSLIAIKKSDELERFPRQLVEKRIHSDYKKRD